MSAYGAEALVKAASSTATVTAIHLSSCGATNCFARLAMTMRTNWPRQNNPVGQISKKLSSPSDKNIPLNPLGKSARPTRPSDPMRGALRTSRTRGEMRWTRRRARRNALIVDGEVVWSWRPGAGAKFAEAKLLQMTVARKPVTVESAK